MLQILTKFANDPNVAKMHEIAIGTQTVQPINCIDYNQECNLYYEGLKYVVNYSKDGVMSASEKEHLNQILTDLKQASSDGQNKIRTQKNKTQ
jgi:hypothetical protein